MARKRAVWGKGKMTGKGKRQSSRFELTAQVQLHANPALGTYNAQSGVIQGILSQMKDDFEKELEDSAKEEEEAESQHAQLMETKRADLALLESTPSS